MKQNIKSGLAITLIALLSCGLTACGTAESIHAQANEPANLSESDSEVTYAESFVEQAPTQRTPVDYTIYESFGLQYDQAKNELYFEGEPVRYFYDGGNCKLMTDFQSEQTEKSAQLNELEKKLAEQRKVTEDVQEWAALIRQNRDAETLDRDMLLKLVERIEVGEACLVNGKKERQIRICYKFAGDIR